MTKWAVQSLNRELRSSDIWLICAFIFIIAIIPRLYPIFVNSLYYDDFMINPTAHMNNFRFGQALEQAIWISLYGSDYPQSIFPKLASLIYLTIGIWTILQIFIVWNIPYLSALMAVLIFVTHPIMTPYLVWNTLSPANLAWVLIFFGYLIQLRTTSYALIAAILLAFMGISTYQIVVALPAMLVLSEAGLRTATGVENQIPWKRRLAWASLPIALYGAAIVLAKLYFGAGSPDGRGILSPQQLTEYSFLLHRYQQSSHGYINVFQPLLSYYFGEPISHSVSWKLWLIPMLSMAVILFSIRIPIRYALLCIAFVILMLILPMSFHWFVNYSSSGWRVALGMLLALNLWFVIFSTILFNNQKFRKFLFPLNLGGLILAMSLVPVTATDAKYRALGSEATRSVLEFLRTAEMTPQAKITLVSVDVEDDTVNKTSRSRVIVMSFQKMTCESYSLARYQDILPSVLASVDDTWASRLSESSEASNQLAQLCSKESPRQKCGILGVRDPNSGQVAICFYGVPLK